MTSHGHALIVVDMQNGFCHPEGSFPRIGLGLEGADAAVRNAAIAVKQARVTVGKSPEGAELCQAMGAR